MNKLIAHAHYLPEFGGYRLLLYSLHPDECPEDEDAPVKWVFVRFGVSFADAATWYRAQTGAPL